MAHDAMHAAYDAADDLIRWFDLHASWPVDLSPLETRFVPIELDMGPGMPRAFVRPATRLGMPPLVVLDKALPPAERRRFFAHEVAHVLCGHTGTVRCLDAGGEWIHERQEAEAWEVAAYLLMPLEAWEWGDPVDVVAARCGVPRWLAEKYDRPWVRFT